MYSQQHTIPMTGNDAGDENSTGTAGSCTQPITSQKKMQKGFLQRLSNRTCSMKAVSTPTSIPEEQASKETNQLRNWGSYENIIEESGTSMARSPSLPSLSTKPVTSCKLLRGSHFPSHMADTPKHHVNIHGKGSEFTPQKQIQTVCPPSAGLTKVIQDFHSKIDQTPQQHTSHSQLFGKAFSAQRTPLHTITPQHHLSMNASEMKHKISRLQEKENCAPKQKQIKEEVLPDWKAELMQEMMRDSPEQAKAPKQQTVKNPSPTDVMRNLFGDSMKQSHEAEPVPLPKQEMRCQEAFKSGFGSQYQPRESLYVTTEPVSALQPPIQPKQLESDYKQSWPNDQVQRTPIPDNRFKQPAPKPAESASQDVIFVNRIAYTVGHRLGRGGSSEVYQVTRQSDNLVLALKCVDLRAVDDSIREGYLNEITLLQRMQGSSRVVQLIDFELCEARQVLFVVMERGSRDLATFLKERSRRRDLKLINVESFWRDMVEAVAAIHEKGIIHSDLKPANFLLVGEVGFHQLKLIDFGIASSLQSDMTSVVRDMPAGTLNYMSPEAIQGMQGQQHPVKINYKSDIWSLGCILYNLLYGRTPFQHVTHPVLKAEAICNPRHHIEFPTHSPSLSEDGYVPSTLLQTVRACLSRDPAARPTAQQLKSIKYCGCNDSIANSLDALAASLASAYRSHPLGRELFARLTAAYHQEDGKNDRHIHA